MKSNIEKDLKKRKLFCKNEKQKKVLKSLIYNLTLSKNLRWKASLLASRLPRNASVTRVRNRCILTGRSRFLIGGFNLSRLMLRKLARDGHLPGIQKSSW